jgi:hypothetical protein
MASLIAPVSYTTASVEQRKAVVNGCGPGGWRFDCVPDSIIHLSIEEACNIHDWMYHEGTKGDEYGRKQADQTFFLNLSIIITNEGGVLEPIRLAAAGLMYGAVREAGTAYYGT